MKAETTTIMLPVTVTELSADKDIELEGVLADYLPNINRIVRADADALCEDVQITAGKAELKGKAVFTLLYQSDLNDKLRCQRFTTDFTQRFDLKDMPEGEIIPHAYARCSYVGCKTLNPRRFILRCRADVRLELKCMQRVQTVSAEDCKGAFFKTGQKEQAVFCPDIIRDFNGEESLSLETMLPIGEIIYASLEFGCPEISKSEGSALVRSEACFKCLYEPEDENALPQLVNRRFSAVFTVDDESIRDEGKVFAELYARSVNAEKDIDAYGENRIIELRYGARLCLSLINKAELSVPTDMFFTEYRCEAKTASLSWEAPAERLRHRLGIDRIMEGELLLDSVLDLNGDVLIDEVLALDDGINIKGSFNVSVLGGSSDGYRGQDFKLAFNETLPFKFDGREHSVKAKVLSVMPTAEIVGGRMAIRVNADLGVDVVYKEKLCFLTSAEIEKRTAEDDKCLIIYYPQKGEDAWDIAKRYYVDPAGLRENNSAVFDKNGVVSESGAVIFM